VELKRIFNKLLLFPEKEAKSVVLLRRKTWDTNLPRSGTTGVWGLAPKKPIRPITFFSRKEAKIVFLKTGV
jgi:hypothetical protein